MKRSLRFSSLRARITLAMLLLGALGSAVFAAGVFIAAERFERVVLNRHIRAEFDALAATLDVRSNVAGSRGALLRTFVGASDPALPPEFAALEAGGYHAVEVGDKAYQVYVGEDRGRKLFVAYDITEWEALEQPVIYVLVAGVLASSLAAVWIGYRASERVIAPVTQLAARLKALDPQERRVRLASDFAGAEVAAIAEAFDRYMERLDGFVEREQLFAAAAAHELRTPLAVLQGSAEVLLEQPGLTARARRAGERIERATREMREFVEALLFLSREGGGSAGDRIGCDVAAIASRLTDDYRALVDEAAVTLASHAANPLELAVPPALPTIVLANLLRNAVDHTQRGRIDVSVDGRTVRVTDTGEGIAPEALDSIFARGYTTKSSGAGMGLHLAKRICDRFGWQLHIANDPSGGVNATVVFS